MTAGASGVDRGEYCRGESDCDGFDAAIHGLVYCFDRSAIGLGLRGDRLGLTRSLSVIDQAVDVFKRYRNFEKQDAFPYSQFYSTKVATPLFGLGKIQLHFGDAFGIINGELEFVVGCLDQTAIQRRLIVTRKCQLITHASGFTLRST